MPDYVLYLLILQTCGNVVSSSSKTVLEIKQCSMFITALYIHHIQILVHIDLLQFLCISLVTCPLTLNIFKANIKKHFLATYSSIVLPGLSLVCLRSHTFICPPNVTAATSCVFVNVILFMVVLSADSNNKYTIIIFLSYEYTKIIYENCGLKNYYMKGDPRSYRCKFCSCGKK